MNDNVDQEYVNRIGVAVVAVEEEVPKGPYQAEPCGDEEYQCDGIGDAVDSKGATDHPPPEVSFHESLSPGIKGRGEVLRNAEEVGEKIRNDDGNIP